MYGINKPNPEITSTNFTKVSSLPIIPPVVIADYAYLRRGAAAVANPESFVADIEKGKYGKVVGIWTGRPKYLKQWVLLNREGQLLSSANALDVTDDLRTKLAEDPHSLDKYVLAAGPNMSLADILNKI